MQKPIESQRILSEKIIIPEWMAKGNKDKKVVLKIKLCLMGLKREKKYPATSYKSGSA